MFRSVLASTWVPIWFHFGINFGSKSTKTATEKGIHFLIAFFSRFLDQFWFPLGFHFCLFSPKWYQKVRLLHRPFSAGVVGSKKSCARESSAPRRGSLSLTFSYSDLGHRIEDLTHASSSAAADLRPYGRAADLGTIR